MNTVRRIAQGSAAVTALGLLVTVVGAGVKFS
jgi:hypothetical protein